MGRYIEQGRGRMVVFFSFQLLRLLLASACIPGNPSIHSSSGSLSVDNFLLLLLPPLACTVSPTPLFPLFPVCLVAIQPVRERHYSIRSNPNRTLPTMKNKTQKTKKFKEYDKLCRTQDKSEGNTRDLKGNKVRP